MLQSYVLFSLRAILICDEFGLQPSRLDVAKPAPRRHNAQQSSHHRPSVDTPSAPFPRSASQRRTGRWRTKNSTTHCEGLCNATRRPSQHITKAFPHPYSQASPVAAMRPAHSACATALPPACRSGASALPRPDVTTAIRAPCRQPQQQKLRRCIRCTAQ